MTGFFFAPRIGWGTGALEQLSGLEARTALLLVDPEVARRAGERRVVEELAKSDTTVEVVTAGDEVDRTSAVRSLADRLAGSSTDWLIALGGGRTIDAAKAARLAVALPGADLGAVSPTQQTADPPRVRLAALPTTSGSGAEVSWTADLTDPDGRPAEIAHRALLPEWALVDPALAEGRRAELVVDGGFEALALAAESYLSAWSNPISDALATGVIATVLERLPHAIRWSEDPDAHEALHYAATSAGLASSNAQRGLAHALARSLTAPTGLAYGRLIGIALPFVLDFDRSGARDRLERVAAAVRSPGDERAELSLAERVRRLQDQARLPVTARAAGARTDRALAELPRIVAEVRRSPGALSSPRVPTDDEIRTLATQVLGDPGSGA